MTLDLSSFEKALQSLLDSIDIYSSGLVPIGSSAEKLFRDGIIQRFEYTFELSWKMLKRYFEMYGLEKVDTFTNKQFFRLAFEQGLIKNAEVWMGYLQRRNLTSHVYDEEVARKVYSTVNDFYLDAKVLLANLRTQISA